MLRLSAPSILPHLASVINLSFQTGTFPAEWKKALVVPLLKTPRPSSPSDTRPIAILCSSSKLIERIVHDQLSSHLTINGLLDPRQSGYRPDHSTQTALLGILEDVREGVERKQLTGLLAFDFSKAFDSLPHPRLLMKLRQVGCSDSAIRWFASYLRDRLQAVKCGNGQHSDWLRLSTGVPQGSVLGPLLFSIFILDLPRVLSFSQYMIFADDLQIFRRATPTAEGLVTLVNELSSDASAVIEWSQVNGLKLNTKKTVAILFGSSQYLSKPTLVCPPPIIVGDASINFSTHLKSLGLTITPSLNFEEHINNICSRVYASLHSLRYYKHALTRSLKKNLVESLIFPHFDYVCAVYHHLTVKQNLRLQRLLNACVRYVYGNIPWMAHVTPYRLALGWLSVDRRREFFIGNLAFKISRSGAPTYLSERFVPAHSRPDIRRSERSYSGFFIQPPSRTESLRNSFSHCAIRLLNSFQDSDLHTVPFETFRSRLWKRLFDNDQRDWLDRALREGLVANPRS